MEEISKTKFKARMFEYLRKVEQTGVPILLSNFGKPTIIIHPYVAKRSIDELFAPLRGKAKLDESSLLASVEDDWIEGEES